MSSPLHIGLTPWQGMEVDSLAQQARVAEELGYESFWLPESHFLERGASPAPLLSLAAAAAVTSRIQLGTVSLLLPMRDPVLLAEEIAVLDRISNGRVIIGLGRGFRPALFRVFGVPVREKRHLFERILGRMIEAWNGSNLDVEEAGEESVPTSLAPLPVQQPHPPLWVAAFGPKALGQAAKLGAPYLASPIETFDQLKKNYEEHAEMLPEGAGNVAVPVMRTVYVNPDPAVVDQVLARLERESRAVLESRSARLRAAASAPIEERVIVGSAEQVRNGIERYREELGLTHLIVRSPIGLDKQEALSSLEQIRELFEPPFGALLPPPDADPSAQDPAPPPTCLAAPDSRARCSPPDPEPPA